MKKLLFLLLLIANSALGYTPSSEAEFSILTCSSGKEIYKVYGHTAIRFKDHKKGMDIVYNYGMFDFSAPHFILRFIQGENYYLLGRERYNRFHNRYYQGGERVSAQILNLDSIETLTLFNALEENAKPENRTYLYNVFYDNCATRVYRILEDNISDTIIWDEKCPPASFRSCLHEYNSVMPFSQLGIDLLFGTKADAPISCREQMFLPEKLMKGLDKAVVAGSEGMLYGKPLIKNTTTILQGRAIHTNKEAKLFHIVFGLLLLISLVARFLVPALVRPLKIILYLLITIASLLLWFMAFFSIHPTVFPNVNLLWVNPLWLQFAVLTIKSKKLSPIFQRILNGWSIVMGLLILSGISGLFYVHPGAMLLMGALVVLSYKKQRKA